MACTAGCPTQDCPSYSACLRAKAPKSLMLDSVKGFDYSREKRFRADNDAFASAVRQGLNPAGVERHHVEAAHRSADKHP